MTAIEIMTLLSAFVTGGGLVAVFTLRSARKSAAEEAESSELSNADKIVSLQTQYIINPLREEIEGLRHDVQRLNQAIDAVKDCEHRDNCPVRKKLSANQKS